MCELMKKDCAVEALARIGVVCWFGEGFDSGVDVLC